MSTRDPSKRARRLGRWMTATMSQMVGDTVRKNEQYGSVDIRIMGSVIARMLQLEDDGLGDQAAVMFYALGKVSRIASALEAGHGPTRDDWHDLAVYALFGLKLHEEGHL